MAKDIRQVLEEHERDLLEIDGVVGVAISECDGRECIMVLIVAKNPQLEADIPEELEGFDVTILEAGSIDSLSTQMPGSNPDIYQVQSDNEAWLMAIDGVQGVGIGLCDDEECIKVLVSADTPEIRGSLPVEIAGYKVEIVESGGPIEIH